MTWKLKPTNLREIVTQIVGPLYDVDVVYLELNSHPKLVTFKTQITPLAPYKKNKKMTEGEASDILTNGITDQHRYTYLKRSGSDTLIQICTNKDSNCVLQIIFYTFASVMCVNISMKCVLCIKHIHICILNMCSKVQIGLTSIYQKILVKVCKHTRNMFTHICIIIETCKIHLS